MSYLFWGALLYVVVAVFCSLVRQHRQRLIAEQSARRGCSDPLP